MRQRAVFPRAVLTGYRSNFLLLTAIATSAATLGGQPIAAGISPAGHLPPARTIRIIHPPVPVSDLAPRKDASSSQRASALIAPSLALVETTFTTLLSVPAPSLDQSSLSTLESSLAQQVAGGQISGDQNSIRDALVAAIDAAPLTYLKPTSDVQSISAQAVEIGTAWALSPNGLFVTPSHVVSPSPQVVTRAFDFEGLAGLASQDAKELAATPGVALTQSELSSLDDAASKYNSHYVSIGKISTQITLQFGHAIAGLESGRKGLVATIVNAKSTTTTKGDISTGLAVIHVNGISNMPTVPIDWSAGENYAGPKSRNPVIKTAVVAYGYPSDFASYASPLTEVSVLGTPASSKMAPLGKSNVFVIDSPLPAGESGAVLVGTNDEAIGIVVAPSSGQYASGSPNRSYAVPAANISLLLQRAGVEYQPSPDQQLYSTALPEWFQHHFKQSLPLFEQIQAISPKDPYASHYVALSKQLINAGLDQTPVSPWTVMLEILLLAAFLRLIVFPLFKYSRKRRVHSRRSSIPSAERYSSNQDTNEAVIPEPETAPENVSRQGQDPSQYGPGEVPNLRIPEPVQGGTSIP